MDVTLYKQLQLIASLTELADELDKGENMDIGWVKYQGDLIRRAITEVAAGSLARLTPE
jgi:hypothetical protein